MPRAQADSLKVLVVDDSATVRTVMQSILSTDARISVSTAPDALIAWAKLQKEPADVVITDLEMPRMDGLTFIRKIMAEAPRPVVVCSGLAARGTDLAIRALEEGAIDVITKPKVGVRDFLHESAVILLDAVWSASQAQLQAKQPLTAEPRRTADAVLPHRGTTFPAVTSERVIAVGSSTGGTEALRVFLKAMPSDCPPILIAQHMPEGFTRAFADRLNGECAIGVKEASQGDRLYPGTAFIAPGNLHMLVERRRAGLSIQLSDGPLVSRHRPSVDVLFRSVAMSVGPKATGVILTGMGDDGAQGMIEMKASGSVNIAQDEATCIVFGMPKEAIARGAVDFVVPLQGIANEVLQRGFARASGIR